MWRWHWRNPRTGSAGSVGSEAGKAAQAQCAVRWLGVVEVGWLEGAPFLRLLSAFGCLSPGSFLVFGCSEPPVERV